MASYHKKIVVNGQVVELRYDPNKAVGRLLKSKPVENMAKAHAEKIRAAAASMFGATNYGVKVIKGQTRSRAIVYTGDKHAVNSNKKHNTLKKALGKNKG